MASQYHTQVRGPGYAGLRMQRLYGSERCLPINDPCGLGTRYSVFDDDGTKLIDFEVEDTLE